MWRITNDEFKVILQRPSHSRKSYHQSLENTKYIKRNKYFYKTDINV